MFDLKGQHPLIGFSLDIGISPTAAGIPPDRKNSSR
jgi:hypothetical protein